MEDIKKTEIWKLGQEILNEYHRKMAKDNFEQFLAAQQKGENKNG